MARQAHHDWKRLTELILTFLLLGGCGGGSSASSPETPVMAPVPAAPPTLEWAITGQLADGGTIEGLLAYPAGEAPTMFNVRSLHPNETFPIGALQLTAHPTVTFLPPVIMVPMLGGTDELCLGVCVFAAPPVLSLTASNGLQTIQLVFTPPPVPVTGLPQTVEQWGTLNPQGSYLKSVSETGVFQGLIVIRSVELTLVPS